MASKKSNNIERIIGILAIVSLVIAWFLGFNRSNRDIQPILKQVLPVADEFELDNSGVYTGWINQSAKQVVGYVAIGTANGYGGPLRIAVATDPNGTIIGLAILESKETPSYLDRVSRSKLLSNILGKTYRDPISTGEDIDAITGATYTSQALIEAAGFGATAIAQRHLDFVPQKTEPVRVNFGIPEATLIGLYAIGFWGHRRQFKFTRQARWVSMIVGMAILGFIFNVPLTIGFINKILMGYWPEWQTNLYWYLLLGGILFVFTVDNKNPYCEWICPFGAAQECMGVIGGAKTRTPQRFRSLFIWVQRGLAWTAIFLALLFRNPGLSSYEVFGSLFSLTGSTIQFLLLGIVLVFAIFIKRPWCNFLCPLRPVTDFIRMVRSWIIETWKKTNLKLIKSAK